jgi:hypothetical protein
MLFAWDNKVDAGTIISVSSELSTLPATNIQHAHLSRQWRTNAANTAHVVVDLGAATSVSLLGVFGTNLTPAATYRLRGSANSDGITAPVYDSTLASAGVKTGYGAIYKSFGPASARYWRLDLVDASLTDIQVGRVFLGPHWTTSINMELDWKIAWADPSEVAHSYGGQSYTDVRPKRRVLEFALNLPSESEMFTNAFAMAKANGVTKDVLAIPDIASAFLSEHSVWGLLNESTPIIQPRIEVFRQRFTVTERL